MTRVTSAVTEIDLGSPRAVADLATFVGRAKRANPEGAVRLQLIGPLLVTTVAVLEGSGLLGEGTVLGLRAVRVASEGALDVTVALAAVSDRLARADCELLAQRPCDGLHWTGHRSGLARYRRPAA